MSKTPLIKRTYDPIMLNVSHLLLANCAATWFMTGLIWFVQIVHYPQFAHVGHDVFAAYHERHMRLTSWVVGPPMLIETFTAVALLIARSAELSAWIAWTGALLVLVIWLSTALLQVPRHHALTAGWSDTAGRVLCATNWIRTIAWSARAVLMLFAMARILHGAWPPGGNAPGCGWTGDIGPCGVGPETLLVCEAASGQLSAGGLYYRWADLGGVARS